MSLVDMHENLMNQGLVPEAERVPFIACSTEYRTRLAQALGEFADDGELKNEIEYLQDRLTELDNELGDVRSERHQAESDLGRAERRVKALEERIEYSIERLRHVDTSAIKCDVDSTLEVLRGES